MLEREIGRQLQISYLRDLLTIAQIWKQIKSSSIKKMGCVCVCVCVCMKSGKVKVLVAQLCPTFATPWTVALQAPVCGILQARILEWVAIPFPEDLPDLGIEPGSPALQADSLPTEPPGKYIYMYIYIHIYIYTLNNI